ncbi:hypothetical protein C1645_828123 [Glomus cerebriforme]|uniref:Uncharacterized protein n=1 Tax=Glomus cerebriforme TaxID=658196 RepID=A0A397SWR7_9GLOM|nr:hypothetical protein C1645_828123 [Glomus cerebriforme]
MASIRHKLEQGLARYERSEAEQPTLQKNFITAKSLFENKNKVVDLPNNDTEIACKPLQDFNKIQEKRNENLEELILKFTADKIFINSVVTFNINNIDK